jgi:hypothetical protein
MTHQGPNLKMAPRAGFEPATQRLTDTCLSSGAAFYCCADFCAAALAVCSPAADLSGGHNTLKCLKISGCPS